VPTTHHDGIIAGGGPTGLMLAAELALARVDVAIVERRENQDLPNARGAGLHARTIEILDVRLADAQYTRTWELPVLGAVTPPKAVLIRPDGHIAWGGEGTGEGLRDALTRWFGSALAGIGLRPQLSISAPTDRSMIERSSFVTELECARYASEPARCTAVLRAAVENVLPLEARHDSTRKRDTRPPVVR
jgi:choline dehydrogenase-like flavoprotein